MVAGAAWVDEICRALDLRDVSPWLPWHRREQGDALGDAEQGQGASGIYLIGWGPSGSGREPRVEPEIEVIYVGETGRARARLVRLEDQVKWGLDHGFGALRDVLEQRDDHRTMKNVWVKMIRVNETALYDSPALTPERVNAIGSRRRQLATVLLAEHYARFGERGAGNQDTARLFLRSAGRGRGRTGPRQEAA